MLSVSVRVALLIGQQYHAVQQYHADDAVLEATPTHLGHFAMVIDFRIVGCFCAVVWRKLEILAGLPSPEEVLALRPSMTLTERLEALLEKNREQGLSLDEEREWERYQYLEHLIRIAKARAAARMRSL